MSSIMNNIHTVEILALESYSVTVGPTGDFQVSHSRLPGLLSFNAFTAALIDKPKPSKTHCVRGVL